MLGISRYKSKTSSKTLVHKVCTIVYFCCRNRLHKEKYNQISEGYPSSSVRRKKVFFGKRCTYLLPSLSISSPVTSFERFRQYDALDCSSFKAGRKAGSRLLRKLPKREREREREMVEGRKQKGFVNLLYRIERIGWKASCLAYTASLNSSSSLSKSI